MWCWLESTAKCTNCAIKLKWVLSLALEWWFREKNIDANAIVKANMLQNGHWKLICAAYNERIRPLFFLLLNLWLCRFLSALKCSLWRHCRFNQVFFGLRETIHRICSSSTHTHFPMPNLSCFTNSRVGERGVIRIFKNRTKYQGIRSPFWFSFTGYILIFTKRSFSVISKSRGVMRKLEYVH